MSEPALKCENDTLKLFITFKMAYFCCFSLGGTLYFPDFLQKKFYNIDFNINKFSTKFNSTISTVFKR